jgi:hypothetical protein
MQGKAPAELDATHRGLRPKEGTAPMARNLSIRTPTPEVLPDDTLETHYSALERMRHHGCYEGFVYLGHMVEDEGGEPEEVIERVPCRRCRATRETL